MHPVAMLFGLVLLAFSVFFVIYPFRSPVRRMRSGSKNLSLSSKDKLSLERQQQAVLLALRDLDFDYQAGKVNEGDYLALRQSLLLEAAQQLQNKETHSEEKIEALIQSRRKAAREGQSSGPVGGHCRYCQAILIEGAKFCSKCGKPVGESTCPKCKQTVRPEDRFCPSCGTAVNSETSASPESSSTASTTAQVESN